ncbi:MAG TPA: radical SAM protein [Candidatus Binatia bacterium]|nr:radical SAM protein [Candidatus Binatia bacterium]
MRPEYREEPCRSALNRVKGMMFGWSLNPYMGCAHQCTFCYVRAFEKRADRPSDDRYGTSIRIKTNVAEVLRRELARKGWKGELVAIGAATDPYQPAEGRYGLTRACLEVLAEAANPFSIITRGPMIVRDVDVLAEAALRAKVSVTFSVPTLDETIWRLTEPNTPPPRQRLKALSTLRAAGIDAGIGMAPILPGLSDRPELLADVVKAARDAGATSIWTNVLYLRPGTREHFLDHLARDWPELVPMYERLFRGRAYLGKAETEPIRREVAELRHRFAVAEPARAPRRPCAIERASAAPGRRRLPRRLERRPTAPGRAEPPGQLRLALDAASAGSVRRAIHRAA